MKKKKLLCFTLSLIFFISLISFKQVITKAGTANKPEFEVNIKSVTPNLHSVGDDITVTGEIIPKEFQLKDLPVKSRDIVIVIDRRVDSNGDIIPLLNKLGDFLTSMKADKFYDKTRIGIISYNQDATIYKDSNNALINLKNYSAITGILDKVKSDTQQYIKEDRNSNIGEALRKAESILHGPETNSKSDKIIILLSNNKSGARTSYKNGEAEGEFYTDISKEVYENVQVYKGIDERSFEYSKKIGEIIKQNNDKIYTISYLEKDTSVTAQLKKLHESIIGKPIEQLDESEKSFFIARDKQGNDIEKVFNEIEKQIASSYEINDIKMNIEFNEGFSLNIDGNTVNVDNITYKLNSTEEEIKKGIIKYIAESVEFQFIIKANKIGKEQEVCADIDILYTWEDEEITQNIKLKNPIKVNVSYGGPDIRILEIEPADSFKLTDKQNERVTTGIENIKRTLNNKEYKIEITHMTMAEFIGKTEQLNGKYDVIVIGRYVDDTLFLANGNLISEKYNQYYNKVNTSWFRDYVSVNNDITDRKSKEIKEFIQTGQLVYIDRNIEQVNDSKLKKNFFDSNDDGDSLIKNSSINDGITLNSILSKYIERIDEQPLLKRPTMFAELSINDGDISTSNFKKGNMEFTLYSNDIENEKVNIKLYLDLNSDTLFKSDEVVKEIRNINISSDGYKFLYNIYEDYKEFVGYLDWKIEIEKNIVDSYEGKIKSYYNGNITLKGLSNEKRVINVLQIDVSYSGRYGLNNKYNDYYNNGIGTENTTEILLPTDNDFQKLLKSQEMANYEINVDMISYADFYGNNKIDDWMKGKYVDIFNYINNIKLNESKYDVVIIGFYSNTNNDSVGNLSNKALQELYDYVAVGRTLILTHDTIMPVQWNNDLTQVSNFIKLFRDYAGQSRYIDPNNESQVGINGKNIEHDLNSSIDIRNKMNSTTLLQIHSGSSFNSNGVYNINKSSISSYPFDLNGELQESEMKVKTTNQQHFQLNLEDENVIPLINLTETDEASGEGNGYLNPYLNRYDSRNSYYAYSKDNITFTSIGENQRNAVDNSVIINELKLLINTIIKATRFSDYIEKNESQNYSVNIRIEDNQGNIVKTNTSVILKNELNSYNEEKKLVDGEINFSNLEIGTYQLDISSILNEYTIQEVKIDKNSINFDITDYINLIIDESNNIREVDIIVSKKEDEEMLVSNLKHGLYESVNSISENTEEELKENGDTRFKFYSSSNIKFAISFETTSKSIKGTLNIDDKFNEVSNISIYKVNTNKLEKIELSSENIKELGNNDFEINIQNMNMNKDNIKILIVYDATINTTNKTFINDFLGKKIKVKSLEENLNILPDLF